ncbi:hypothetical protein Drorol1_Dr00021624 [Drosera rotundifolia]
MSLSLIRPKVFGWIDFGWFGCRGVGVGVNPASFVAEVIGAVIKTIGCSLDSGVAKFGDWSRRLRVWDYCGVTVVVCWGTPAAFGVFGAANSGEFGLVFWCGEVRQWCSVASDGRLCVILLRSRVVSPVVWV